MSSARSSIKMASAGILSAVLASSCCIIPILALLAGSTGMASTFSWVEPIRPYLIVLSISVLSLAWYQKLKPKPEALDCCAAVEKPNFIQSKTFLVIITVLALAMMSFPLYADLFFKPDNSEHKTLDQSNLIQVEFEISGMTCTGCETHIEQAVSKLPGIALVNASFDSLNTLVRYDTIQTSLQQIQEAIGSTGYVISGIHKN